MRNVRRDAATGKRVIACRKPSQSTEVDLLCNGVQLTGAGYRRPPEDGLLRWRPLLISVAQGVQLWLEHLVYCASGGSGEVACFCARRVAISAT